MTVKTANGDYSNEVPGGADGQELTAAALRQGCPVLASLDLSAAEMNALRQQGFVSHDLDRGNQVYKLRFRHEGHQRVCCFDTWKVAALQIELSVLQSGLRSTRRRAKLNRYVRREMRASARQLVSTVEEFGFHFHGRQLRRCRPAKPR